MHIHKRILIIFMVFLPLLCIVSCRKAEESHMMNQELYVTMDDVQTDINEIYPEGVVIEDTLALEDVLTSAYDLYELRAFFENRCSNSRIENTGETMYFDEVNERYPVAVIRPQGYSVYKVSQGGYFYVFWVKSVDIEEGERKYRPVVYFAAYLSSRLESEKFESIEVGKSTACDVREIDTEAEFNFLLSHGIYSYSFLNENEIMQIKYTLPSKGFNDYDDLIVESMTVVPREENISQFSSILSKDLP